MTTKLSTVFLGLSITSSWGNGHATTYRALLRELAQLGHRGLFLERAAPWYESNADMPVPPFCETASYSSLAELFALYGDAIASADAVILGSYVPEGARIAEYMLEHCTGVRAFYDIDTPITLRALEDDSCGYLDRSQVQEFDVYLSFSGGPILQQLVDQYGARRAEALYCSVDPRLYYPSENAQSWQLGYLGTYSDDRQPVLERLLVEPARQLPRRRFVVAGPQYPKELIWPRNVDLRMHVPPWEHRLFYGAQRATLNVTRRDMVSAGYSPSVRLFEAAACGVPIISDIWPGIETFFAPGEEIMLAETNYEVLDHLMSLTDARRADIALRARARVSREHTAARRAQQLQDILLSTAEARPRPRTLRYTRPGHDEAPLLRAVDD
jgi:spore maturation protein CgeB